MLESPTTEPQLSRPPSRSLRSTAGLERGRWGSWPWSFQSCRRGCRDPQKRDLSHHLRALGSSPTTAISSAEKASRYLRTIHNVSIRAIARGHLGLSQAALPGRSFVHELLYGNTSCGYPPGKAAWVLAVRGRGGGDQGKLASGRCPGCPWIHCQKTGGSRKNTGLGVRRAELESPLHSDLPGWLWQSPCPSVAQRPHMSNQGARRTSPLSRVPVDMNLF